MNLFELFVKIGADTTEANKGIDEVGQKTSGLGEKLKSGLATAGKVAAAGVTAGIAALGTLGTKAVSAYADKRQSVRFFDLKTMLQTVGYCVAHGGYGWTELDGA